jgi:hypothetical protein
MSKSKMPTSDGERIPVSQLNIGSDPGAKERKRGRISRMFRNVSLFMAGMYTGVGCGGTPKKYHSYDRNRDDGPV